MATVTALKRGFVRTEMEVAADAVMSLFDRGLLANNAPTLVRVSEVTGIPGSELRAAWERIKRRGYRPPSMRSADPAIPPAPVAPPAPQQMGMAKANERRFAHKTPAPGMRSCARCKQTKPVLDFDVKDQRTGAMKSYCRSCTKAYQRERYLKATEVGLISNIRLLIEAGSPFLASACDACGHALAVGEEVEACDVALRHVRCGVTVVEVKADVL